MRLISFSLAMKSDLMFPRSTLQFPSRARRARGFAMRFAACPRCRRHFRLPRRPRDRVPAGVRRPRRQGDPPGRTQSGRVCAHPPETHRGQARPLQVVRPHALVYHAPSLSEEAVADLYRLDFRSRRVRGNFMIVEAVPKSPAGKILRRMLKDTKGTLITVYEEKIRAKL